MYFRKKRKTTKGDGRKKYSDEFRSLAISHFKKSIQERKAPNQEMCENFLESLPLHFKNTAATANISWNNVKDMIWNISKRNKGQKKPETPKKVANRVRSLDSSTYKRCTPILT